MDLIYELGAAFQDFMDASPGALLGLVLIWVVGLPFVLLHELGHGVAAVLLLDEDAELAVGTTAELASVRLGRISVTLNALSDPRSPAGVAEFDDARASARDVVLIALAGPAVSLLGTVATAWAMSAVGPGVVHDLLWAATAWGAVLAFNLVPMTLTKRRGGPTTFKSDGRLALDALRVVWALR